MKLLRIGKKGYEIPAAIDKNGKYRNLSPHISDLNPDTINFETLDILKNINLEKLDEKNIGMLLIHFFLETKFASALLNVNPYGQPGVERGKIITREFISKMKRKT